MSVIEPSKKTSKNVVYEVSSSTEETSSSQEGEWAAPSEEGSLDKVRDILFGAQSREIEKRFAVLENRLLQESGRLREDLTRSVEDLKMHMNQEILGLVGKLEQEQDQRASTIQDMGQTVKTIETQISQRIVELTEHTSNQFQAMGAEMQKQNHELIEQGQEAMSRMEAQFQQAVNELKVEKTDRAVLAEMLMDVALRLKVGTKNTQTQS
ncbi:MAG: hypothetical protein MRJ67_18365 [Nitrospirales bacterium]|nr:hypothetical protein [Nitrospirales bacterium]MDR4482997.1 hypothetical protein [Nitrospirales bacterium]